MQRERDTFKSYKYDLEDLQRTYAKECDHNEILNARNRDLAIAIENAGIENGEKEFKEVQIELISKDEEINKLKGKLRAIQMDFEAGKDIIMVMKEELQAKNKSIKELISSKQLSMSDDPQ